MQLTRLMRCVLQTLHEFQHGRSDYKLADGSPLGMPDGVPLGILIAEAEFRLHLIVGDREISVAISELIDRVLITMYQLDQFVMAERAQTKYVRTDGSKIVAQMNEHEFVVHIELVDGTSRVIFREPPPTVAGTPDTFDLHAITTAGMSALESIAAATGSRSRYESESLETTPSDGQKVHDSVLRVDQDALLAFFGNTKLEINAKAEFGILSSLVTSLGDVVDFETLWKATGNMEGWGKSTEAPPAVKDAVSRIRRAFKNADCPAKITNVRQTGYRLER